MISCMGMKLTNLDKLRFELQVAGVREKFLKTQVENLKAVEQIESVKILDATRSSEAHWPENLSAVEVTHAVEQSAALAKLAKLS